MHRPPRDPRCLLIAARSARAASSARIATVGGGLAGIRCAHMLWDGGSRITSTVCSSGERAATEVMHPHRRLALTAVEALRDSRVTHRPTT